MTFFVAFRFYWIGIKCKNEPPKGNIQAADTSIIHSMWKPKEVETKERVVKWMMLYGTRKYDKNRLGAREKSRLISLNDDCKSFRFVLFCLHRSENTNAKASAKWIFTFLSQSKSRSNLSRRTGFFRWIEFNWNWMIGLPQHHRLTQFLDGLSFRYQKPLLSVCACVCSL